MGTRRSRHNKGRKPFYKEVDRETIRGIEWSAPKVIRERQVPQVRHLTARLRQRQPSNVHLVEEVQAFLARRNAPAPDLVALHNRFDGKCQYCGKDTELSYTAPRDDRATRDHVIPRSRGGTDDPDNITLACGRCNQLKANKDLSGGRELRIISDLSYVNRHIEYGMPAEDRVAASHRDILLQLYAERKISAFQLRAGRAWQFDMERAAIQPNATIDWSEPRGGLHYQRRGDITEAQHEAMARRREFARAMGCHTVRALDFCLDVDRGRDQLASILRCSKKSVHEMMSRLLDLIAASTGEESRDMRRSWVWRAAA